MWKIFIGGLDYVHVKLLKSDKAGTSVSCHLSITLQTTLGKDSAVKVAKFLSLNLCIIVL